MGRVTGTLSEMPEEGEEENTNSSKQCSASRTKAMAFSSVKITIVTQRIEMK